MSYGSYETLIVERQDTPDEYNHFELKVELTTGLILEQVEYENRIAKARLETEEMLDEARRDAEALRQREEQRARDEAEKLLERAHREIDIAKETAVKDLYARATELSTSVAQSILEREIQAKDHERLISDAIAGIEHMERN